MCETFLKHLSSVISLDGVMAPGTCEHEQIQIVKDQTMVTNKIYSVILISSKI